MEGKQRCWMMMKKILPLSLKVSVPTTACSPLTHSSHFVFCFSSLSILFCQEAPMAEEQEKMLHQRPVIVFTYPTNILNWMYHNFFFQMRGTHIYSMGVFNQQFRDSYALGVYSNVGMCTKSLRKYCCIIKHLIMNTNFKKL